ncbi:MAG: hypothetical protein Q7S58_07780 [Candidatus Binatus sp.]|uniref:hypothetical protein n=1 Tax=Candidatus Binatus sp. TaxID=2811406 RepID=UPI00271979A6|nr:hypothetical protein [Candidatus Binatus sp.]MDO8432295.1 hypothetical protein [Candidatus Binatus sp.]
MAVEFESIGSESSRARAASEMLEGAWRQYRRRMNAAIDQALSIQDEAAEQMGIDEIPPEITLYTGAAASVVMASDFDPKDPESLCTHKVNIYSLVCWAGWRESKPVYSIEPALAQCLSNTPWPEQTPLAALRLPSRFPVLVFPKAADSDRPTAVGIRYDIETGDDGKNALEMRFNFLEAAVAPAWIQFGTLRLTGATLGECFQAYLKSIEIRSTEAGRSAVVQVMREDPYLRLAITTLLYLGGEPDTVRVVHPGSKPAVKESIRKKDPERWRDLREPDARTVGRQFQQTIERWEIEQQHKSDGGSGRNLRPHIRRAHSHLYWTGEGRKLPRVKFLLPIPVKGAGPKDERTAPAIGRVN